MNSDTTSNSGNNAQRSFIKNNHGDGSMLSQLEHLSHRDNPVKMSALHDSTTNSRIAGDDFGGLPPKDQSDSGTGSKQRDSGFIDFTPTPSHSNTVYHGLNSMFFKKQAGHGDHSSASTSLGHVHDDHNDHRGNHTGFSITGLSTLSHKDPSSHVSTSHSMIPTQFTSEDSSDLSLGTHYVEDQVGSSKKIKSSHEEKQSGSSQSIPLGHQIHRAHSPHHDKGLDRDGDKISSQSVHQPIHRSVMDSDGLFDSAHPSTFPSTKHKKLSKGGEKSHESEINIGELPNHGAPSSAIPGVGAGLVSLGAAAAAAAHHISNPTAVNYAASAPMAHHDSLSTRTAAPKGSFFTQPATHHGGPSHTNLNHSSGLDSSAHSGASEPHPSSILAHHSVTASSILDAHNEHIASSTSHVSRGPAHVVAVAAPAHRAPVHIETIHEAYHGPTTQSAPTTGHSQQSVHVETIHKPYYGGPMSASSTGTKESELGRSGSQSSTGASKTSSAPVSTSPKKKTWFGFEIREKEKKPDAPPRALSLGFGFKETKKAAMEAAKARRAPPKASTSVPISTPIATPSAPAAISAQGVHDSNASSSSSSTPATVSAQGAHLATNEGLSSLPLAAISAQGVHSASNAGPTSSASVSNPSIVSVQPIHPVGRSSPAPHSFSPSQDRPVHPDISYHTKKKSKKAGGSNLFSAPMVPASMGRSHVPPKAPVSTTAQTSSPAPVVASSSRRAPISSSNALSAHVSGLTSLPVHSQHQHHANSPVTPEILAAAVTAGSVAAISHHHGHSEKAFLHAIATPAYSAGLSSTSSALAQLPAAGQSIPEKSTAAHWILPHEHATAAALRKPKVDLSLYPEEESAYPRGEESHHENPDYPKLPVAVQEVQLDAKDQHAHNDLHAPVIAAAVERHDRTEPKTAGQSIPEKSTAAHWILPHEHATAAALRKPKVDLSLYPEEESAYPRGEESHHENPDYPKLPVAVQEVQLDAKDQHAYNDLHPSKKAVAAAAVASGLGSIKSAFSNIYLPGRRKSDTPKEVFAEATSATTPIAVASVDAPVVTAVPATTTTTAEKEPVHTDAAPAKSISDLASARAAAASALATSPTLDDSKSKFSTSEHGLLDEGSSISARQVETFVVDPNAAVLATDKATSTDPSVAVSSHPATSKVSTAGSHPVPAEIGPSTHPVDPPTSTSTTSKSGTAVPLAIIGAAMAAPLATHALKKHDDVDAEKTIVTSTTVHDGDITEAKHIDKSTISKPISATPLNTSTSATGEKPVLIEDIPKEKALTKTTTAVATTADDDALKPATVAAAVETEKERKKREKKELKKEQKELKAKEKAEKKALKEKEKKPPVDISRKLSSIAAPAAAAIAAASASTSNPHNRDSAPIRLKGQNFLLSESDVEHPTVVPVSQTLLLTEDDVHHPSAPIVSQKLTLNEDDVEKPSVPIVSQKLTLAEDDVEKPVLVQPSMPVLRIHEEDVPKPDISHGHLVIPKVAPKAVSTSALKVAKAPRPMIPPRPIVVKKEKVKTNKRLKIPKVRMPKFKKDKASKVKEEKAVAVEDVTALAAVPVTETFRESEAPKPVVVPEPKVETFVLEPPKPKVETFVLAPPKPKVVETHVVEAPKPAVVKVAKPAAVAAAVAATTAAAVALPPSPNPVVIQGNKTHHVEVPKPAPVDAVTTAAAVALPPSPKPAPVVAGTKAVEAPQPVVVEPPRPVPVVAPIAAAPIATAPVVAADATPAMKTIPTTHEYTPAPQKEEITVDSAPVVMAPEGYTGPIPSINSGETVVWVKKVYTSQEYYDSENEDDLDEFGYRKDRDPSRYLPLQHRMPNTDQRRIHTRPGSAEALAQHQMPAQQQQQRQGVVGNNGGYNTQPRQSAM